MTPTTIKQAIQMAVGHHQAGRLAAAEAIYRQVLAQFPEHAGALHLLGVLAGQTDNAAAAIELFGRAIAIDPGVAEYHGSLGEAHRRSGWREGAIASFRRAIELDPNGASAYYGLGNVHKDQGLLDPAIAAYNRAIELKPGLAGAHSELGIALSHQGRHDEAIAALRRAIALRPDYPVAHSNLGVALKHAGRLDESVDALGRSIALRPDHAEVYNNLGSTLLAQGDREHALDAFHRALALKPSYFAAHSNVLMCEQYRPGATLAGLACAHAEWEERHAAPYRAGWTPWGLDRDPERPLRLGFVSADLRRHPVGYFLVRVLQNLDPGFCAVVCYHTSAVRDDMTDRLRAAANEWHDVVGLDEAELAARVRTDRIDILFDLAGHSADHRLLVFARRPAPVQISWIGYVGTTGLKGMDYLIADRFHVPPSALAYYFERVLTMPDGYVCFEPPAEAPAIGPLPALGRGSFTFGSFNNVSKITPEVITLWAEIVRGVPGSRLLLVAPALDGSTARERIGAAFVAAGGDPAQLELRGALPWADLLACYNSIDVALDPFPYSGGLTTCEALWMGVPVVTWPGETFASRHSLSHLSNVGLTETVAANPREYVELARRLAGDLPHLAAIRAGLRDRMAHSPLCDGPRFAGHLMALLREVWGEWCRGSTSQSGSE